VRVQLRMQSVKLARFFSSTIPSYLPSSTVCIVGSGPSGLYSAKYLLKDDAGVRVDVIDYLPSPFGESIKRLVVETINISISTYNMITSYLF